VSDAADTLVKLGLTALAVVAFIVPEAASSVVGFGAIAALWGEDVSDALGGGG
jgi:hypothetical protein